MPDGEQPPEGAETPRAPALRASDAERERTATLLREHTAAGRLTPEELAERLDSAYDARTVGELTALTADLPGTADPAGAPAGAKPPRSAARERARRHLLHAVGQAAIVSLACIAIWLATGAPENFWPKWVVLGMAIRVAVAGWAELGPGGTAASREAREGRGGALPPGER